MVFIHFKQDGAVSTSNGNPMKLVDQFTYVSSHILSTESDVNTLIGKAWTTLDR